MKALPDYYIKAVALGIEAVDVASSTSARLPDLQTPHGYLMRSRVARRPAGGYVLLYRRAGAEGEFKGMGACNDQTLAGLIVKARGAFNRQHKGGDSVASMAKHVRRFTR